MGTNMGTKGRAVPRIVCCAIPISQDGKVLVVTSRKRPDCWVCEYSGSTCQVETRSDSLFFYSFPLKMGHVVPKGGWEPTDVQLEDAASREAFEEGPTPCSSLRHLTSWYIPPISSLTIPHNASPPFSPTSSPPCTFANKKPGFEAPSRIMSKRFNLLQWPTTFSSWM